MYLRILSNFLGVNKFEEIFFLKKKLQAVHFLKRGGGFVKWTAGSLFYTFFLLKPSLIPCISYSKDKRNVGGLHFLEASVMKCLQIKFFFQMWTKKTENGRHVKTGLLIHCKEESLTNYLPTFFNKLILRLGLKTIKNSRHTSTAIFQHRKKASLINYQPNFFINWIFKVSSKNWKSGRHTSKCI